LPRELLTLKHSINGELQLFDKDDHQRLKVKLADPVLFFAGTFDL
jgi:hypothetical protein